MNPRLLRIFSLLLLIASPLFASPQVQTYDQLLHAIRQTRHASQQRIEAAVKQEKVREAWETGKLIDEHILLHKERQNYGEKVIEKLANDLQTSKSELNRMVEFARSFDAAPRQLSWAHYRELLAINDPKEREKIAAEAHNQKWSQKELRHQIQKRRILSSPNALVGDLQTLEAKPGKVGTYRITKNYAGEIYLDLGFSNYLKLDKKQKFKEGDIVHLEKGELKKSSEGQTALFTYTAHVLEVLDGDTLRVELDLGFGFTSVQKLRLRGLDAPELVSAEGKEAKAFLEKEIAKVKSQILIKSAKSDKYDRYLADVWVEEKYLNQELIDKELALRV